MAPDSHKKTKCPDCHHCQMCSKSRCRLCHTRGHVNAPSELGPGFTYGHYKEWKRKKEEDLKWIIQ